MLAKSQNDESKVCGSHSGWRSLVFAVMFAVLMHFFASAAMALFLGQGLETNTDITSRLSFICNNGPIWVGGWLLWNVAALSLLNFFVVFRLAHAGVASHLLTLCIVLTATAIACDLSAETIEMALIPQVASHALSTAPGTEEAHASALATFLLLHRIVVLLSGYVANGLYSVATGIAAMACRKHYPHWVSAFGIGVLLVGIVESVACLMDFAVGMFLAHCILMPCFLLWLAGIGVDARQRSLVP